MTVPRGQPRRRIPHFDILMGVGQKYYPDPSFFIEEAIRLGVSKRLPDFPPFHCPLRNRLYFVHWRTRTIFAYATGLVLRLFVHPDSPVCKEEKEKRAKLCGCDNPSCILCAPYGSLPGDGAERGCGYINPRGRYIKRYDGQFLEDDKQLYKSLTGPWRKLRKQFALLKHFIANYIAILNDVNDSWSHDQIYYTAKACALYTLMSKVGSQPAIRDKGEACMLRGEGGDIYVLYKSIPYTGHFTRGYRYVEVDLHSGRYTIIKIKVRKVKERKEQPLESYTISINLHSKGRPNTPSRLM